MEVLVRVTFYVLLGWMFNGQYVHLGAAACSHDFPIGTHLLLQDGFEVVCEDRGLGDYYWSEWIDVWAPSYSWGVENVSHAYGDWTTVLVE